MSGTVFNSFFQEKRLNQSKCRRSKLDFKVCKVPVKTKQNKDAIHSYQEKMKGERVNPHIGQILKAIPLNGGLNDMYKNNLKGITLRIRPIWGINFLNSQSLLIKSS